MQARGPELFGAWFRENGWIVAAAAFAIALVAGAIAFSGAANASDAHRADVEPKYSLEEYTWEELAAISADIAQCESETDAIWRAGEFWLCRENGAIDSSQYKVVDLADGTAVRVALAGVWRDTRTDGGKAGLTFVLLDAAGTHAMNHSSEDPSGDSADSTGGWEASDMRAWLEGDLLNQLPFDLRDRIVSVQKRTANAVDAADEQDAPGGIVGTSADWVRETSDKLWLFSASELCGDIPANDTLGVDDSMSRIYSAEGTQYQRFRYGGVEAFAPNALLERSNAGGSKPCTWWLRTKTLEFGDGFWLVGTDGTPLNGIGEDARVVDDPEYAPSKLWGPDHARGVVVGFCL